MSEQLQQLADLGEIDEQRDANVNITDAEIDALEQLRDADSEIEILEAVSTLSHQPKTPESVAVLSAAGDMLADELTGGNE